MLPQPTPFSKDDVHPGDLLLYVMKKMPEFLPWTPDNLETNFGVMVDLLIIHLSGSMCTHAAVAAAAPNFVVEATMPRCRYRTPIWVDGYEVKVRRVRAPGKGALVLQYLPPGIDPGSPDHNLSYAYVQSATAALLCLFRRQSTANPQARDAALVLLQLVLHPLTRAIDEAIAHHEGTTGAWFCSQLAAHVYDEAAEVDPDYRLHFPPLDREGGTLASWLAAQVPASKGPRRHRSVKAPAPGPLVSPRVLEAGLDLLRALGAEVPASAPAPAVRALTRVPQAADLWDDLGPLLTALGVDPQRSVHEGLQEAFEALVMPSDLEREDALVEAGVLVDLS